MKTKQEINDEIDKTTMQYNRELNRTDYQYASEKNAVLAVLDMRIRILTELLWVVE